MLVEVALIKLTRPSMEPNLDAILQRLGEIWKPRWNLEAGRMAILMAAACQGQAAPAGQVPGTGAGPGADGGTVTQTLRRMLGTSGRFGAARKVALPRPDWKT